jgi:pimeloyl-ACP methyl ester carboxylesterase
MTAKRLLFAPSASAGAIGLGMQELRACRPETLERDVAIARSMDLTDAARTLRLPTLVVCGRRDQVTPPELSRELSALVAGSRLVIVEGAGHMLQIETPAAVNAEIATFVDSVASPSRLSRGRIVSDRCPTIPRASRLLAELRRLLSSR